LNSDEVHRLSPEGQEMLFLLLDKGIYRRLGETEMTRKANILIVGATTEDINSSLLRTFLRRIPMVIKLPSLSERPFSERYRLVKQFFKDEFKRVQVPIKVYKDVIKALLLYECTGNIGQLKGDIQLICARAFLEYKSYGRDHLEIDTHLLPDHVYSGLLNSKNNRDEIINLLQLDSSKYQIFSQQSSEEFNFIDNYSVSDELYKEIGTKWSFYTEKGYSQQQVKEIINSQIEEYFTKLLKRCNTHIRDNNEEFYKLVSPRVLKAVEIALNVAEQKLNKKFDDKVKFGLAMHVSTLLERLREGKIAYSSHINKIVLDYPREFNAAKLIRRILEEELEITVPKEETGLIAMFLYAVGTYGQQKNNTIGVIVLAHGKSTASSMVDVANSLLGTDHAKAIDMPLDKKVEDVLNETTELVKRTNKGKGVLMLVDMGSLAAFAELVTNRTNIKTCAIEMVSTPMVIEAVRKSLLPEMTLETLVKDIQQISPYIGRNVTKNIRSKAYSEKPKTIITTCLTGEGTAVKISQLLKKSLKVIDEYNIAVKPMNIDKRLDRSDIDVSNVLAVVGTVDLEIPGVPYISIDEIITGDGFRKIENVISNSTDAMDTGIGSDCSVIIKILEDTLSFINPYKAYDTIMASFNQLSKVYYFKDSRELKIKYIFHCSSMLERLIRKEPLSYKNIKQRLCESEELYKDVKNSITLLEESFGIEAPDTEIGYIIDLLDTHRYTEAIPSAN
jgi:transcriptional regulatory protein LevR